METNRKANVNRWVDDRLGSLTPGVDWQPDAPRALARLRERRAAESGRARRWGWVIAAAAASFSLAAFPATRAFAERCASACVSESDKLFGSAPSVAYMKPQDRKLAPDFTLSDASGRPVKLSEFRGKVVLLNFWATWCAPCKLEIPWFVEFQQTYRDRDFEVLGVSLDEDGWKPVKPYIAAERIDYPVMVGNEEISRQYGGLESIPTTLIIDKSGRIASIHVGLCSRSEYETDINAALNER
jgi:peroxiredoxin